MSAHEVAVQRVMNSEAQINYARPQVARYLLDNLIEELAVVNEVFRKSLTVHSSITHLRLVARAAVHAGMDIGAYRDSMLALFQDLANALGEDQKCPVCSGEGKVQEVRGPDPATEVQLVECSACAGRATLSAAFWHSYSELQTARAKLAALHAGGSREIKNQLCIDGTLNTALQAVLVSTSPSETNAILTGLAHAAVDRALNTNTNENQP